MTATNALVHRLPKENFELVKCICEFLFQVKSKEEINLMNLKNIEIIFHPTLNIPGPLITLFVGSYREIFERKIAEDDSPIADMEAAAAVAAAAAAATGQPSSPSDYAIRSPQRRTVSDLHASPAYSRPSFTNQAAAAAVTGRAPTQDTRKTQRQQSVPDVAGSHPIPIEPTYGLGKPDEILGFKSRQ